MYPIPAKCPICGDELFVERLVCGQCGTALEGSFITQRLTRLTPAQWDFVEIFLRCEGKLNRVQEELNISYPTVRTRLHEIIRAMGYEVGDASDADDEITYAILDDLAEGRTTVEDVLNFFKSGN